MISKSTKNNRLVKFVFFILTCFILIKVGQNNCYAESRTVFVSQQDILAATPEKAIQKALDEAKTKASAGAPYIVKVESGVYELNDALRIYSNTTLDVTGVELIRKIQTNILRVGVYNAPDDSSGYRGYYYKNIAVIGGVFNGNNFGGTIIKVGHCQNFSMKGCTLENDYNGHEMEVAGVDGFYVDNCVFKNQVIDRTSSALCFEAIQLDILFREHINGFRSEALPNKNIKITNSKFDNVPRGVGSHTAILNAPVDGIQISGCQFSNISSAAIQGLGWVNCVINNNKINNAARGIAMYAIRSGGRGTYLGSVIDSEGKTFSDISTEYKPDDHQNIQILDNNIVLNGYPDAYTDLQVAGIQLLGYNITSIQQNSDKSGTLPIGNYYISDVIIRNNFIVSTGCGISLRDVVGASVANNKVEHKAGFLENDSLDGIYVYYGSKDISIENNELQKSKDNGIIVEKSEIKNIALNTITKSSGRGIWLNQQTVCTGMVNGNKLDGCKAGGIKVSKKSNVEKIYYNTISNVAGSAGITVNAEAVVERIESNKITVGGKTTVNGYVDGIKISEGAVCKEIFSNTISTKDKSKKFLLGKGIWVNESASVSNIWDNKISKGHGEGVDISSCTGPMEISCNAFRKVKCDAIIIQPSPVGDVITIKDNDIKGYKEYTGIRVINGNVQIKNNEISNVLRGIHTNAATKGVIYSNTITKAEKDKVYASRYDMKGYGTNQAAPEIKSLEAKDGVLIYKWEELKGYTYYEVVYSTKSDFSSEDTTTIQVTGDKKSVKIKDLTPKKKYYVKIRGIKQCNGTLTINGIYSKAKSVVLK